MKKTLTLLTVTGILAALSPALQAQTILVYSGNLSYANGDLVATGPWAANSTEISWEISYNQTSELWFYEYEFEAPRKDTSHVVFQACEDCATVPINDLVFDLSDFTGVEEGRYRPGQSGNSNPGLPGTISGFKFNAKDNRTSWSLGITTANAPQWGDVYLKSGRHHGEWVYAHNSGLTQNDQDPSGPITNGPNQGHLPVVGCGPGVPGVIPEPSSLLLTSLAGLGLLRRRR